LVFFVVFCFFKQKTAYEMRISDWSSDVCSSDLEVAVGFEPVFVGFDGECADQAQAAGGVGEYPHDIGSPPDFLIEAFEHVGAFHVLVMPAWQPVEGEGLL